MLITCLQHGNLIECGKLIPRFHILLLIYPTEKMYEKYEKHGKHLINCNWHRSVFSTYATKEEKISCRPWRRKRLSIRLHISWFSAPELILCVSLLSCWSFFLNKYLEEAFTLCVLGAWNTHRPILPSGYLINKLILCSTDMNFSQHGLPVAVLQKNCSQNRLHFPKYIRGRDRFDKI